MSTHRFVVVITVSATLGLPSVATAQQHRAALGDLMTALVQPRHIKHGLAGNEQNWAYAAYELDQLRETFNDVAQIMPKYRDLSCRRSSSRWRHSTGQSRLRTATSSVPPTDN